MPNFKLTENDLNSRLDKWLFFIRHLEDFQTIPTIFADEIFMQAFEKAELAKFGQTELDSYDNSLKIDHELKGVIDTAFDEGKLEVAKNLKKEGMATEFIIKVTRLTKDKIDRL